MTDGSYPQSSVAVPAPSEVETAFKLWIADICLSIVSILLSFLILDKLIDLSGVAVKLPSGVTPDQLRTGVIIGIVFVSIVYLIIYAVAVLFALKMRAGRNWARIVLTVLGGIGLVIGLLGLGQTFAFFGLGLVGSLIALLALVQLVLIAAAIIFMFRPVASAYFAGPSYR